MVRSWLAIAMVLLAAARAGAAGSPTLGPFNAEFPQGGDGFTRAVAAADWRLGAGAPWSMSGWINLKDSVAGTMLVGGVGDADANGIFLTVSGRGVGLSGPVTPIGGRAALALGRWYLLTATSDGSRVRLFVDGRQVGEGLAGGHGGGVLRLAPRVAGFTPYSGGMAGFTVTHEALSADQVRAVAAHPPDFSLTVFATGSPSWPVQLTNAPGQLTPQDAWTLPTSRTPASPAVAMPPYDGAAIVATEANRWSLPRWSLMLAPRVHADGAALSTPGYDTAAWYPATVPGTVLTTLVDRGVYPDPAYGLNNMAIPESLARQDSWYRTEFTAPATLPAHQQLIFGGINYAAEVWLNGARLGTIRGAFTRGQFDVSGLLRVGASNAVAVRTSPPPHPGIPNEESLHGAGFNGGMQALDGPTFFATEGWDWIPGIRDRDAGLWQGVTLSGTGALRLGDAQVVTTLPQGAGGAALIELSVPVTNLTDRSITAEVGAEFDATSVRVGFTAAPGTTEVKLGRVQVDHPKLWWPNGYGEPALHTATFTVSDHGTVSDMATTRFGIRQMTYELSLMDPGGHLRRVELDYSAARAAAERITDGRHEAVRKIPGGWVNSLTEAGARSAAVHALTDTRLTPYLVIKVNGVRIAARGGSWGTDDLMKRISRERLEPYFRLHREAGVNVIRNWMGQNTEPVFYDLADEYGLLIVNDFWDSTQNYQEEPADIPLFLANAADTFRRYRNHPSIALWFGRNEGIPPPMLNEGLQDLAYSIDGTRWYTGSSNEVNLWGSGPYNYREPAEYFIGLARGFSVEVGSMSFPTLEAFEAMVPPSERWPVSDTWAYHDWHQDGNGDTHGFVKAMDAKLGPATSLPDFERKAQLLNFETYRAIMEGMNADLWSKTSGRMLWMTHPAWPSTMWQIYSHDYDTHAAFYGFKSAAERVHVQLRLPDYRLQLINNGQSALAGVRVTARTFALDGRPLGEQRVMLAAGAGLEVDGPLLASAAVLAQEGAVVARLEAEAADGSLLSRNTYWLTRDAAGSRRLSAMSSQPFSVAAEGNGKNTTVVVRNMGSAPALNAKLTIQAADGSRVLPAYYSDNYVSLLPGEERSITIETPAGHPARVALRGWNVQPQTVDIGGAK